MKNKKGFTLVELLVVIIIIGLLIALTTVSVVTIRRKQEVQNRKNTINSILTAAKAYVADHPEKLDLFDYGNDYVPIHINDLIDSDYLSIDKNTYNTLVFDGGVEEELKFKDTSLFETGGACYGTKYEIKLPQVTGQVTKNFEYNEKCKDAFFDKYKTYIYKYNGYYGPEKENTYRAVHIKKCENNPDKVYYFIYDQKADIDKLTYSDAYYSEFLSLKENDKKDKIEYSDCGCEEQKSGSESKEMCTEIK